MAAQMPPVARSTFVTVLAWIFIALAGFATFISILQNIMIAFVFPMAQMQAAATQQGAPWFAAWMIQHFQLFFLLFLVASASCLAAAIGLLRRKNWARLLFIALMLLGIAWNVAGLVLGAFFLSSFPFGQAFPGRSSGGGPLPGHVQGHVRHQRDRRRGVHVPVRLDHQAARVRGRPARIRRGELTIPAQIEDDHPWLWVR